MFDGAAALGPNIYLFGGVSSTIYQLTGTSFTVAGSLPSATADAAVATVASTLATTSAVVILRPSFVVRRRSTRIASARAPT
jgi:hypothetical protein